MWEDEFVIGARWWTAFGLALCVPVLTLLPLMMQLTVRQPALTTGQSGYTGQFSSALPGEMIWTWLPLLSLVLGWTSLVAAVLAYRANAGRSRVFLSVAFAVLFLPTLAVSFGVLG